MIALTVWSHHSSLRISGLKSRSLYCLILTVACLPLQTDSYHHPSDYNLTLVTHNVGMTVIKHHTNPHEGRGRELSYLRWNSTGTRIVNMCLFLWREYI